MAAVHEEMSKTESPPDVQKKKKSSVVILTICLVLDLLAFTCILPLFPYILEFYSEKEPNGSIYQWFNQLLTTFKQSIGAPDVTRFNYVFYGGLLGSLFSFLQFLSSPFIGACSDCFGRKPMLMLSVAGSLVSYWLWSQAVNFNIFLVSRVVGGLSKSSITIATAVISDVSNSKTRGRGMAMIGIAFSIGFLFGPSIGAYFARQARISDTSSGLPVYPAYFAMILTVAELILITFMLPESLDKANRKSGFRHLYQNAFNYVNPRSLFAFASLDTKIDPSAREHVRKVGLVYFCYLFLYSGLEFTLSFLTHIKFNYDSSQQGRMYLFGGLIMVVLQGAYVRRIKSENQLRAALRGLAFIIPSFVIIGLANTQLMLYIGLTLYSVASAIVVPCLTTVVSSVGEDCDKGLLLGVFRSLGALARALGPFAAAAVFWCLGPVACYITGGLLLSVPYLMLRKIQIDTAIKLKNKSE